MSVTALRPEAPLRLLHPLWCVEVHQSDEDPHRGRETCWEAGDVRFIMNRIRYDEPRYINGQRQDVDENGGPAPERGKEHIELRMTDTASCNHDGSPITVAVDLTASALQMALAMQQQQLDILKSDKSSDWQGRADWPREETATV